MIDPQRVGIAVEYARTPYCREHNITASEILTAQELDLPLAEVQRVLDKYIEITAQVSKYKRPR